eukprot:scaffold152923_cov28-Tisochrysis_lutea.AAC.2
MAFCQMPCVLREADVCIRLFAGIRTRPAVAGMVAVAPPRAAAGSEEGEGGLGRRPLPIPVGGGDRVH